MRFGVKLTVFLAVTLLVILGGVGYAGYQAIRDMLIDQGKAQVAAAAQQFVRQLDEIEGDITAGVALISLEVALRQAVTEHDRGSVTSVLSRDRRRIGASRMMLVETDGTISADTGGPTDAARFAFPALLDGARDEGRASSIVVPDRDAVWVVVIPVLAPDPIAFLAAVLPLDDSLLARIRALTAMPQASGLVTAGADGVWRTAAGSLDARLVASLPGPERALPVQPGIRRSLLGETIFEAAALATPQGTPMVAAVFSYPLTDALQNYDRLVLVLLAGICSGLVVVLLGGWLIARGVRQPLGQLVQYARSVGSGQYAPPPLAQCGGEIGRLNTALGDMARAIAVREERIRRQAGYEPVTNLPNRQALMQDIDTRTAGEQAAVMVIALLRLQEIANTVGHDIAERMMRDAAKRLSGLFVAAPLGCIGERSFAALLAGCDPDGALVTGRRVIESFDQPYREGELTVDASVAVGIAVSPAHGIGAELLLRRAEVALQAAIHVEGRAAIYQAGNDPHRPERLSLMSDLRQAMQRGDLHLYYQPKLDIRSGCITGVEALVRWMHPAQGLIPNEEFISLAEETGNVQHLTRWALETGLAQAAHWRGLGLELLVSINISARDLADRALPERISALLLRYALPGEALVLEVTEGAIMREAESAIAVLRRLAAQGITIAVDDFGVGQSSLTYLRRLPVGELKIDKDFVLGLPDDADNQTIVRSVIDLGHSLGFVVTAEGVQNEATIELLRRFGCDYAQGNFIARALPSEELAHLVEAWPHHLSANTGAH